LRAGTKHRAQEILLLRWPAKFNYRILLHGWRDSLCGLLKTTSTIAFQQVTPPFSTHRRTPDSVIAPRTADHPWIRETRTGVPFWEMTMLGWIQGITLSTVLFVLLFVVQKMLFHPYAGFALLDWLILLISVGSCLMLPAVRRMQRAHISLLLICNAAVAFLLSFWLMASVFQESL
jgi:hypothetical protein